MNKKTITEQEKLSMFEEIRRELENLRESLSDKEFDAASEKMIKNWGGAIEKEKSAKLSPEDMFDMIDAGAAAKADIESEFGEDEFMPMTNDEYSNLMGDIDEAVDEKGLFQVEDAEGNIIKRHALIIPVNGVEKKGRVMGFGDDGQGRMQLLVTWEWPIEMRHTNPEEMGKDRVYPEDIVLAASKNLEEDIVDDEDDFDSKLELDSLQFDTSSLYKWILDALHQLDIYSKEDIAMAMEKAFERDYNYGLKINEMRGLGHGVKNSGDRNVKLRDDHHEAPLTNLDESVDVGIKKLFEGKVTKKKLKDFISEQARNIANKLNN